MNKDLISVIIPVFNAEKYFGKCLESVINQTYDNLEIIIVNDGSNDNSLNIIKEYKDSRIKLLNKDNSGVSSTRNLGLQVCTGKYICFIDADDYTDSNFIECLYYDLIKHNCDLTMSNIKYILPHRSNVIDSNSKLISGKEEFYKNIHTYSGYIWHKMFVAEYAKKIRFDENIHLCEDLLFLIEYIELTNKSFYFDSNVLYYYCINNSALSRFKEWNESKITIIDAYKQIMSIVSKYDSSIYNIFLFDYFYYLNDIYKRYSKKDDIKQLRKQVYKEIINSKYVSSKDKIKSFIKKNFYSIFMLRRGD